jgi:hypothetical protein
MASDQAEASQQLLDQFISLASPIGTETGPRPSQRSKNHATCDAAALRGPALTAHLKVTVKGRVQALINIEFFRDWWPIP